MKKLAVIAILFNTLSVLAQGPLGPISGNSVTQTQLNNGLATRVPTTRTVSTTTPLSGGGDLSANRTIVIQQASGSQAGYLSSADWTTFNEKLGTGAINVSVQAYNANTTTAGNTFNGVSQLLQLNSSGQIPALDAHLVTGLISSQIPSLDTAKVTTGVFAYQRIATGGDGSGTHFAADDGTFKAVTSASGGTVTSVAMTVPSWLTVAGSPITTSGTLAVTAATGQTANYIMAAPDGSSGAISPRAMVVNDIPANLVTYAKIQQVSSKKIIGNSTGSTATPIEIGIDGGLSFSGSTLRAFGPTQALAAYAIDPTTGKSFTKTLTAGTNTFTWSNFADGDVIIVRLKQVASGSVGTVVFPSTGSDGAHTTRWKGGSQPTQTVTFDKIDRYIFQNFGGDVDAFSDQNY